MGDEAGGTEKRRYSMRTRSAGAAQTRERILAEAFALWCAHAYDDVTIQRIADAAGVSAQTVLVHFGSKEGVIDGLIASRRPAEEALRAVPAGDVDAAARAICARYEEIGAATMRLLAIEDRVEAARRVVAVGRASHRAWVDRTFGRAVRSRGAARERRLMALVAAFDLYTWSVLRRVLGAAETERAMAELAWGVLGRPAAGGPRRRVTGKNDKKKRGAAT